MASLLLDTIPVDITMIDQLLDILKVLAAMFGGSGITAIIVGRALRDKTIAETAAIKAATAKANAEVVEVEAKTNEIVERVAEKLAGQWQDCEKRYVALVAEAKGDRDVLHKRLTELESEGRECLRNYEKLRELVTRQSAELEVYRRLAVPAGPTGPVHIKGTLDGTVVPAEEEDA